MPHGPRTHGRQIEKCKIKHRQQEMSLLLSSSWLADSLTPRLPTLSATRLFRLLYCPRPVQYRIILCILAISRTHTLGCIIIIIILIMFKAPQIQFQYTI